jgi:hypothetical protein
MSDWIPVLMGFAWLAVMALVMGVMVSSVIIAMWVFLIGPAIDWHIEQAEKAEREDV